MKNGSGISSSFCGPLCRLSDYWKIPANKLSGFARILHLSLCYLLLWLIVSSNSPRYSGMLGGFSSVKIQRWNLLRPGLTLTSWPVSLWEFNWPSFSACSEYRCPLPIRPKGLQVPLRSQSVDLVENSPAPDPRLSQLLTCNQDPSFYLAPYAKSFLSNTAI